MPNCAETSSALPTGLLSLLQTPCDLCALRPSFLVAYVELWDLPRCRSETEMRASPSREIHFHCTDGVVMGAAHNGAQ